ncbi:hypothetical protein E2C01_023580 [Portunus trituberculatus]|uniref:Uncharacterized protein n=1 Tax=Portunus trituberculatus TaxID=210409 RepID=A0A5B7EA87_PORTR|nr:hypothetical protein [Portunus trituberculatus]
MYASMTDTITSIMYSAQCTDIWVSDTRTVIIPGKINIKHSQVPTNWLRENARGISDLGSPEEELEK